MGSTEVLMEETENESSFTAMKEFIMSFPIDTKLVRIHDANLSRGDLECLFKNDGWLSGDVSKHVNIYIITSVHEKCLIYLYIIMFLS